jgi:hypothetical protein
MLFSKKIILLFTHFIHWNLHTRSTDEMYTNLIYGLCNYCFTNPEYKAWNYIAIGLVSDSIHRPVEDKRPQRFGDWICLRPQVDGAGQTYSAGPVRKC